MSICKRLVFGSNYLTQNSKIFLKITFFSFLRITKKINDICNFSGVRNLMMASRDPPTPLKNQPESKRPKTPVGATNENLSSEVQTKDATTRNLRGVALVPLPKFSGLNIPTNSEVLRRIFFLRDE